MMFRKHGQEMEPTQRLEVGEDEEFNEWFDKLVADIEQKEIAEEIEEVKVQPPKRFRL